MTFAITLEDVRQAKRRIDEHLVRTPLLPCEVLSAELDCELRLKCENLQHNGAFKSRGACNAVSALSEEQAMRGVATHSSGNHAAALAWAAKRRGIPAHIVMPYNSAKVKLEAVRRLGVEPVLCEPDPESRQAKADEVVAQTGATLIHPYNEPLVMAGQGTVGLEILEQWSDVDVIVVPVGGGGLLSGMLTAVKAIKPAVKVFAAEPAWADDAYRSWRAGSIQPATRFDTIADGLRTTLGTNTFPIIQQLVEEVLLVEEDEILETTRLLIENTRTMLEPSGAVSVAAVRHYRELFSGLKVAAVISGGNIDRELFIQLLSGSKQAHN